MGGVSPILYRLVVLAGPVKIHAGVKFQAATQIFTISCENSKILSRLLGVLSLHRKFVHDHCCCPNSAIILTVSKMEAILDFGRGCQNLEMARRPAALVITFEGGSERGGRRREGGVNMSLY